MNKENRLNLDGFPSLADSEVAITREQQTSNLYRVFIDDLIGNGQTYRTLITLLGSATEDDTFVFHLSSPGGELEPAIQVYLAMLNTRAHTVAQIDSYAASAATLFVMAAKQVLLSPHAYMMIHGATWGAVGHMQEVKRVVDFQHQRMLNILYDVYKGFLSEDEIKHMVEDQIDIYMSSDEIIERLNKRQEIEDKAIEIAESKPKRTRRGTKKDD